MYLVTSKVQMDIEWPLTVHVIFWPSNFLPSRGI